MRARLLYREGLALFRELDARQWVLGTLRKLGNTALTAGDYAEARTYYLEVLEKAQAWGDPIEARYVLCGLGDVALAGGDPGKATGFYLRAVQGAIEVGEFSSVDRVSLSLAKLSAQRGEWARAAELVAFAYHVLATYAAFAWDWVAFAGGRELERALEEHLSPDELAAAQERGRARQVESTLRELLTELEGEA